MLELGDFGTAGTDRRIIGKGSFLECLEQLQLGNCDCIFGARGGTLVIHDDAVVYRRNHEPLFFSPVDYLGEWRMIKDIPMDTKVEVVLHQFD